MSAPTPCLFNVAGGWRGHLACAIRKERKGVQIGKEEIKVSLFMDNMIVHMGSLTENLTHCLPDPSGLSLHIVKIATSCMVVCSPARL